MDQMLIRKTIDKNKIHLIEKYYHKFAHPEKSRFSDFFKQLLKEEDINADTFSKTFDININEILLGRDQRTSLIIKGFPSQMQPQEVLYILSQFTKNINYFYIPPSVKEQKKYMYAFVNLANYKSIISLFIGLSDLRDKYKNIYGFDFTQIEVYYSKTQGLKSLMKKSHENKV